MAEVLCRLIQYKLTVKNAGNEPGTQQYNARVENGESLLQALQRLDNECNDFSFETTKTSRIAPYLVKVNNVSKGPDLFWDAFLYNEQTKDVIPIPLEYIICPNDNVYLRIGFF